MLTDSSARCAWSVTEPGPSTTTGTPRSRATKPPSQAAVQPPSGRPGPPASARAPSPPSQRVVRRGREARHVHRHLQLEGQPAVGEPERIDSRCRRSASTDSGGLARQQPAIGRQDALGRHDRRTGATVDRPHAPARGPDQRVRVRRQLVVQAFELAGHRGRAVHGVRATVRVARMGGAAGDRDPQERIATRADDRLQLGRLRHHAPPVRRTVVGVVRHEPADAFAGLLLVDQRGQLDRAAERDTGRPERVPAR